MAVFSKLFGKECKPSGRSLKVELANTTLYKEISADRILREYGVEISDDVPKYLLIGHPRKAIRHSNYSLYESLYKAAENDTRKRDWSVKAREARERISQHAGKLRKSDDSAADYLDEFNEITNYAGDRLYRKISEADTDKQSIRDAWKKENSALAKKKSQVKGAASTALGMFSRFSSAAVGYLVSSLITERFGDIDFINDNSTAIDLAAGAVFYLVTGPIIDSYVGWKDKKIAGKHLAEKDAVNRNLSIYKDIIMRQTLVETALTLHNYFPKHVKFLGNKSERQIREDVKKYEEKYIQYIR